MMRKVSWNQWFLDGLTIASYGLMVGLNSAANLVPINGLMTGEISDRFLNLFAPSGSTFAIWGLIYVSLCVYVVYQMAVFHPRRRPLEQRALNRVAWLFIVSSFANSAWIVAWHYLWMGTSLILIVGVLVCLALACLELQHARLESSDHMWIVRPMHIYFGWITVATIANVTTYLVFIKWDGFGFPIPLWMNLMVVIGALIGARAAVKLSSLSYLAVLIWAYLGIVFKHTSTLNGFAGRYPSVLLSTGSALLGFLSLALWMMLQRRRSFS
jgi:hypothetical protein